MDLQEETDSSLIESDEEYCVNSSDYTTSDNESL